MITFEQIDFLKYADIQKILDLNQKGEEKTMDDSKKCTQEAVEEQDERYAMLKSPMHRTNVTHSHFPKDFLLSKGERQCA